MTLRKPKTVAFRRRREQRTDYQKRLRLLTSGKLRLAVRFTNSKIIAQVIAFRESGDEILVAADSQQLQKLGWPYTGKNMPAAYLVGLLIGKRALAQGAKEAIFDTGMMAPLKKGRAFAFLKGALDAGMAIPHGAADIFPSAERLNGGHIQAYAKLAKGKQFAQYLKSNNPPEQLVEKVEQVKKNIQKEK